MLKRWRGQVSTVLTGLVLGSFFVGIHTPAQADGPTSVKVNEVESNGGTPGDWIELINTGATPADISGYKLKDNDDIHAFSVIPEGTVLAAGGYYVVEEAALGYGLGTADSARFFAPDGSTVIDSYSWTAHAANTYGRCPNGTGAFANQNTSTKGAVNDCGATTPTVAAWPGSPDVSTADTANFFGTNMSGLDYEATGTATPGVLWAVKNGPGTLYRLVTSNGNDWAADTSGNWANGKKLHYPGGGTADPDAEGITFTDAGPNAGIYVSTERDNTASGVSRPAILLFDPTAAGTDLNAVKDWNLTPDLPGLGANLGLEAIQWIPDSYLVAKGFRDEKTGAAYNPANYADHGTGLFFVGVEANGNIYAYALNHSDGSYTRIAVIASGFPSIMDLEFEAETGHLWAQCDNTCNGRSAALDITPAGANAGKFAVTMVYERPANLPNVNNEGFTIAPQAECVAGKKPVFWTDDDQTSEHALRKGSINCTVPVTPPSAWPGGSATATADDPNVLGGNMSGLAYEGSGSAGPGVLWAVKNGPGTLYRLVSADGDNWAPDPANNWNAGKKLNYPGGAAGDPDAEGVAFTDAGPAAGIYVSTERNNSVSGTSRPTILQFDPASPGSSINATREWNLTPDLPGLGANLGLEAIEWISDSFLVSRGFQDEKTGAAYNPANYANHGDGLFFVGVEANGMIYAYALNHVDGSYTRIAAIASGFPAVMDLEFDPETTHLWAACDDTCNGRTAALDIAQTGVNAGKFGVTTVFERPAGLPNVNNEGFAIAPQSECVAGSKRVFWTDDNNTGGHALRRGTIDCTVLPATSTALSLIAPTTVITTSVLTLQASVSAGSDPVGTGSVAFLDGTTVIGTVPVVDGKASLEYPGTGKKIKVGKHNFSAKLQAGNGYAASTSAVRAVDVYFKDMLPGRPFTADTIALAEAGVINGYDDGSFRPGAIVDRQTAAAFLYRVSSDAGSPVACEGAARFKDVPSTHRFCAEIEWAAEKGISTGYADGTFRPGTAISREAAAAFLYRLAHPGAPAPVCTSAPFADVSATSKFCGEVTWMKDQGISTGAIDSEGVAQFAPASPVTRQAFAAFLNRYLN